MDEDVRPVGVELTANNGQYDQAMRQSAAETQQLENGVDRISQKLDSLSKSAGKKLILIGAADIALLSGAAAAAGNLEGQMSSLDAQAQATQRSMSQGKRVYGEYKDSVASLRKEFPLTTRDATDLVNVISRLSDSSRPIDEVARSFTRLSGATGEGPAQLAAGVLTLSRQMGNGTREIDAYNNTILRLSATTGGGASALVSFTSTLAPAGRQLRITQTDLLGISTAFSRAGQDGNLAANAFNKMANDISVAIQTNSPELKTYADLIGMTTEQLKGSNKTDVISQIFESLNKQGPDAIRTLQRLGFEGQRNLRAIQGVSQQQGGIAGAVRDARAGFAEGGGAGSTLQRASEAAFNGLGDQTRKQTEALKKNAEAFGAPFALIGTKFLEGTTAITNAAGELIDGPLGKIGMMAAGILGPVAILTGSLLLMAKALATVAGIRFVAGSGLAGFMGQMGSGPNLGGGRMTRNTTASIMAGRGNFISRGTYGAGSWLGATLQGARDDAARTRVASPGMASRAAGTAAHLGARGMDMMGTMYGPLQMRGFNDPTKRNNFFTSSTLGGAIMNGPLGRAAGAFTGAAREGFDRGNQMRDDAALRRMGAEPINKGAQMRETLAGLGNRDLREETVQATRNMRSFGRGLGELGTSTVKFTGTLASAAAGATRLGAAGAGRLAAATGMGPLGLGLLGVSAGSMIYDKVRDKDTSSDYKDYESYLGRYAQSAGTTVSARSYTAQDQFDQRYQDAKAGDLRSAITTGSSDLSIARSSQRKTVDDRITSEMTKEQILQLIAPDFASMDVIPPEMVQSLKYDLLDTRSSSETSDILRQLVDPNGKGKKANIAGNVAYDPAAIFAGASGKADQNKAVQNMLAAAEARANAAQLTGGDEAYGATLRGGFLKGLDTGVFGKGGLWKDKGGQLDTLGGAAVGGGQEAFKNFFERTFGATLDIGTKWSDDIRTGGRGATNIKNSEDFLRTAMMSGDSTLGSFYSKMGIDPELNPTNMKGDERKKAVDQIMKMFSSDFVLVGGVPTAKSQQYDKVAATMGGKDLATTFLGDQETGLRGNAMTKSMENVGNASKQYEAIIEQLGNMADKGDDLVAIQEKLRQTAAVLGDRDEGDFARATRQYAAGRMQQQMSMEDPFTQAQYATDQHSRLAATIPSERDDTWATDIQASQGQLDAIETQMDAMLKNLVLQSREFSIQQTQAVESFGISRGRSEEDFNRSRARATDDYYKGVKRAETDFDLQRRQGRADFNLSRLRQEEDFNHQVEMMAAQSAKSIYNIYDRVAVQRTQSVQNIMINGADQLSRMQKQSADLDKLRGAGLSDDAIQQMGLGDAANAQQAGRLVAELGNSPEIVKQLNKQVKARLKAAKDLVTDDSSQEWEEMNRSYKLGRERAEDDFEKQVKRSRTSFKLQLKRQREDFGLSMDRQVDDFGRSMGRMASDFDRTQNQAKDAMERSIEDMQKSGEDLLAETGDQLDGAAGVAKDKILGSLQTIRAESKKIYDGIKRDFTDVFGDDKGNEARAPKGKKKTWFELNSPLPKDWGGAGGGMGGDSHEHGVGCGHGGSMLPQVLNGSGGTTGSPDSGKSKKESWQKPINRPLGSPYGMRRHPVTGVVKLHDGNDFPAPLGTPYGAAGDGVVRTTARTAWGGNVPYIDHGNGIQTFYGHSSSISVSPGQKVRKGQIVGKVGSVGYSTGPHLHFGALNAGRPFNSMDLIAGAGAGKLTGSGKSVPGMDGDKAQIELQKRYPALEAAAAQLPGAFAIAPDALSDRINAKAEELAKSWGATSAYGGGVDTWYGNGAIFNAATPIGGGKGVGERGSELLLPLNGQGVDFLHGLLDKFALGSNAVGGQQIVNNIVNQTRIDKSTTFTGAITVQANDPNEFLRTLQAQQRQAALVNPTLAGARR